MPAFAFDAPPKDISKEHLSHHLRRIEDPPNFNWHVMYTQYLERISAGNVTGATKKEIQDAETWDDIRFAAIRAEEKELAHLASVSWENEPSLKPPSLETLLCKSLEAVQKQKALNPPPPQAPLPPPCPGPLPMKKRGSTKFGTRIPTPSTSPSTEPLEKS